jgi:hypothetical protein
MPLDDSTPVDNASDGLDDGVVISPGFFEAMRQILHRLIAPASPNEKSRCCRTKPTD